MPRIIKPTQTFRFSEAGMHIHNELTAPDAWMTELNDMEQANSSINHGEIEHTCRVPMILYYKWREEGFDILDDAVTAEMIAARLRLEDMSKLVVAGNRI